MYCHTPTQITECELNRKKKLPCHSGPTCFWWRRLLGTLRSCTDLLHCLYWSVRLCILLLLHVGVGLVGWGGLGQQHICTCKKTWCYVIRSCVLHLSILFISYVILSCRWYVILLGWGWLGEVGRGNSVLVLAHPFITVTSETFISCYLIFFLALVHSLFTLGYICLMLCSKKSLSPPYPGKNDVSRVSRVDATSEELLFYFYDNTTQCYGNYVVLRRKNFSRVDATSEDLDLYFYCTTTRCYVVSTTWCYVTRTFPEMRLRHKKFPCTSTTRWPQIWQEKSLTRQKDVKKVCKVLEKLPKTTEQTLPEVLHAFSNIDFKMKRNISYFLLPWIRNIRLI